MCIVVLRVLRTEGQMRHLLDVMDQDHLMWRVAGTCDQWQYHYYYYYWSQVLNGKKLHTAFMMHHVICFIACSVITNMVYAPQSLKQSSENPYHKQCWAPILVCLNLCTKVKCYVLCVICNLLYSITSQFTYIVRSFLCLFVISIVILDDSILRIAKAETSILYCQYNFAWLVMLVCVNGINWMTTQTTAWSRKL